MDDPHNDIESVKGSISTTILTPSMTSENTLEEYKTILNSSTLLDSSIPQAGSSFIIRHVATDKVVTFQEGDIRLGDIGGHTIRFGGNALKRRDGSDFGTPRHTCSWVITTAESSAARSNTIRVSRNFVCDTRQEAATIFS
jgi:hypothetical protein